MVDDQDQVDVARSLLESLTQRERDVLDLVLLHQTSKEIARELAIAPNTVDMRIKNARRKLGVSDRAELARYYTSIKATCGLTTCGFPVIDESRPRQEEKAQELPLEPNFQINDASFARQFYWERPVTLLEAMDEKFGRMGRVGGILLGALAFALIVLIVVSLSVALGDLV